MSDNNWAIFKDVKMYNSKTDTTIATNPYVNMEYLFNMTGATPDDDPAETSLFNLTTLKTLVSLGQNTVNIINQPNMTYEVDFQLSQDWTNLGETLKLSDPAVQGDVATKRTYLLWLWMQSAWDMTFTREKPETQGGSY